MIATLGRVLNSKASHELWRLLTVRPTQAIGRVQVKPFFWQIKMKNAELEAHIKSLGDLMEAAYAKYEQSSCFNDLGEAHAWRMRMEAAIASRSPSQVANMEAERGLA